MRVRFTQDYAAYLADQYRIENFKKGQEFTGPFCQQLIDIGCPVETVEEDDPEGPGVDLDGDGVPEGSAAQVTDWVTEGDDETQHRQRAELALAAEEAKGDRARSTLIAALTRLLS
jgi:hypothetical protein